MTTELVKSYRANVEVREGKDVGSPDVTRKIVVSARVADVSKDTREEAVEYAQTLYNALLDAINDEYDPAQGLKP